MSDLHKHEFAAPTPRESTTESAASVPVRIEELVLGEGALEAMDLPPREPLIGDWCPVSSCGMVYAPRGVGKSRFAYACVRALASGVDFGEWRIHRPIKCMIVDGEMPLEDIKSRLDESRGYFDGIEGNIEIEVLSKIRVLEERKGRINIVDVSWREKILHYAEDNGIGFIVLDNISTLTAGLDENVAHDWQEMENFILDCRASGIGVMLIHHSGKNGLQRGTSKREDALEWIIELQQIKRPDGAAISCHFRKSRHCPEPDVVELHFQKCESSTRAKLKISPVSKDLSIIKAIDELGGTAKKKELAEHLGMTGSQLRKCLEALKNPEWVESKHHEVTLTPEGEKAVSH